MLLFSVSCKNMKILFISDSRLERVQYPVFTYPITFSSRSGLKAFDIENHIFHRDFDLFMLILCGNDVHFHPRKNPVPRTPAAGAAKMQNVKKLKH